MNRIRTLIADDEPLAREGIAVMLEGDPEIEVVGCCGDGQATVEEIRAKRPDLAFIDVHMPRLNGLEALGQLWAPEHPTVIFVTAHDRYALQAFEVRAVDYLLKPFRDDRFRTALARAKEQIVRRRFGQMKDQAEAVVDLCRDPAARPAGRAKPGAPEAERLVVKVGSDFVFLNPEDIAWIEAQGNCIQLSAGGQIHRVREPLQRVEERLGAGNLVRVHRSFLVNVRHIRRIAPVFYGGYDVLMSDGVKIRLSRSYRHALSTLMPAGFK